MPMNKRLYPPDWETVIRPAILERAANRCEQCGVPNHVLILRSRRDPVRYLIYDAASDRHTLDGYQVRLSEIPDEFDGDQYVRVILTIAHLDHDITNNDHANLRALCQRCHLLHDARLHAQHARATRAAKRREGKIQTGQAPLFEID